MTALTLLLALSSAAPPGDFAVYRLSIEPPSDDFALVVLEAEIPKVPDALANPGAVVLWDSGKKAVPVQFVQAKETTKVFWAVNDIKKGRAESWEFFIHTTGVEHKSRIAAIAYPTLAGDPLGSSRSVEIKVGEEPFTSLLADPLQKKPYLYPLLLGKLHLERRWPMDEAAGEDHDHVHQRSFWFTHGDVNGVDFWSEEPKEKKGTIRQTAQVGWGQGDVFAPLTTPNEWIAPDGKKLLDDQRTMRFYDFGDRGRVIDFEAKLTATEGSVTFGDTKEGTFGIRLAESMKEKRGGRIENSRGKVSMKETWGKPAEWIDYTGTVEGKTVGVAIFDHPTSFRHPTTWHVRDYGLFAANPFGLKDFTGDKTKDGSHKLEKGQSITFKYRVLLHPGTTAEANVAAAYRAFANPPKVKVERMERTK